MSEVRGVCQRILDGPTPPMRDGAHVLAIARRAKRRRAHATLVSGGVAVAAVAALAAGRQLLDAPAPPPAISVVASATTPPHVPTRTAADAHGSALAQRLSEAVPAGYTGVPGFANHATSTWLLASQPNSTYERYVSQTRILVSDGVGEGALTATIVSDGEPAPVGDLCAPAVTARLAAYVGVELARCDIAAINGESIRTSTTAGDAAAVRFIGGGLVIVAWTSNTSTGRGREDVQSGPWWRSEGQGRPPLAASPFTVRQLAQLAADTRMLP